MALNCQDENRLNHRNNEDSDGDSDSDSDNDDEIFTKSPKITKLFSKNPDSNNLNINENIVKPMEQENIKKSGLKVQVPSNITCYCTGNIVMILS